jgi:hypothetical protein
MKNCIKVLAMVVVLLCTGKQPAQAQDRNITEHEVVYYYLPDWEIYYYVPENQWIYFDGKHWVYEDHAPEWFNDKRVYKVDLDYKGNTPYINHVYNREKYPSHNPSAGGPRYRAGEKEKQTVKN